MSNYTGSLSKLNKKELIDIATNLRKDNQDWEERFNELQDVNELLKIMGEGEFSPAIYEKEYRELLKSKLEIQDKYNELNKKYNPNKDVVRIANKKNDKLEKELYELKDMAEQYEDNKMKLNKLAEHHKRLSDNHEKIIIANKTLYEENEKLKEDKENKILKDTIYEKDEEIKELHKKLKQGEELGKKADIHYEKKIYKLTDKLNHFKTKHDLLYQYFNLQEPQ
tara:strand:- start:5619 stop:6290 length:672 start_codon:yes stop_codon:yes gene_type:complete